MPGFAEALDAIGSASQPAPIAAPAAAPSTGGAFSSALSVLDSKPIATGDATSFNDRFSAAPEASKPEFSWSRAVTDIPKEIKSAAGQAVGHITNLSKRSEQGPIEGLMTTGRAALAVPELIASPITGTARSLIGHTMANAEHAAGTLIAPEIAAKDDPEKMYEVGKGDADLAMSALGGKAPSVSKVPVRAPTIQELKLSASRGFDHAEVSALAIKPEAVKSFSEGSQAALAADGVDETLAPKTFGVLKKFENPPEGSIVTGRNVQSMRRALGHAAASPDPTERLAASTAIDHLDHWLSPSGIAPEHVISGDLGKASQILENARGDYAAAKHAETIDNKTIQAELRAASANSGQNVANTVRSRMADILIKPKEQRGFTSDELDQMEKIVRGTKTQNAMRYAGNVMGGGGGLGAAIVGGGSTLAAGPVGMAVPIAGYALKSLSNRMTLQQASKLSEMIRSRSPLASSMEKFETSAGAADSSRTAKTVAGLVISSRNLANNLKTMGINISPAELVQGALAPSSADDENGSPRPRGQ